jgi:PAS domain S-box-containing protein
MIVFAVIFGTRHTSTRNQHEGFVVAIAFESIIKMVAILAVGFYGIFYVFDGPNDMEDWLTSNKDLLSTMHTTLNEGPWHALLLMFFASAVVMPHMFYMTFTENMNRRALNTASWGMPVFLLIMSLPIPIILWAGLKLGLRYSPSYFTLTIGLHEGSEWLTVLTFIGGLAAASGLIIVVTLALSAMCLNHLILPSLPIREGINIYKNVLWIRRILIIAIVTASYFLYLAIGTDQNLSDLGLAAFVATLQFLPGVMGLLFWPTGNRQGFLSGLVGGIAVWVIGILVPLVSGHSVLDFYDFTYTFAGQQSGYLIALGATMVNVTLFILVSVMTETNEDEQATAQACAVDTLTTPQRRQLDILSAEEFRERLAKPLGTKTAIREVDRALLDLQLPLHEDRPYALRRLRDQLEANLSGLMGPVLAKSILDRNIPYKETPVGGALDDIHFIESRIENYNQQMTGLAAELDSLRRYHRMTLQNLPMGVCSIGGDGEILMWNRAISELTEVDERDIVGAHISTVPDPWGDVLQTFTEDESTHHHKKTVEFGGRTHWFNLHKAVIFRDRQIDSPYTGSIVILIEDLTDTQLLEEELIHSERLASIGRFAAGVAHEIGNPITGINCLAQDIKYETDNPELKDMAEQIIEQTKRVSNIVQTLVSFAHAGTHKSDRSLTPVHINQCINEAINLLTLSQKNQRYVEFINHCDPELQVIGDAQRLVQVFVNLIGNARDASPDGTSVIVRSMASELSCVIEVIDEGHGIAEDKIDQIFDPFFTTKEPGEGTGLGLAMVYSIIEEHHGNIQVDSPAYPETGKGSRFAITIPRHNNDNDDDPERPEASE